MSTLVVQSVCYGSLHRLKKAYILADFAPSFEGWFSSRPLRICQTVLELRSRRQVSAWEVLEHYWADACMVPKFCRSRRERTCVRVSMVLPMGFFCGFGFDTWDLADYQSACSGSISHEKIFKLR
ncbi:hypothetical protein JB92DRAFT_2838933 [Gautieria morchelliformis]|nr:hypothetical protein JB92DRAFT_2838933 [Gautieria morchelliformis]